MFTDTHCNKRRREETRSEGGCTSCRGKKKKRERRRTKSEVEKKSESEGMCDAMKKKSAKRDGKSYGERSINGDRTGEEADGIAVEEDGKRGRAG